MEKGLSAAADGPFLWILWEGSLKALDREGHFLYNMPRLNPMDEGETAVEDWRGLAAGGVGLRTYFNKGVRKP